MSLMPIKMSTAWRLAGLLYALLLLTAFALLGWDEPWWIGLGLMLLVAAALGGLIGWLWGRGHVR